MKKMKLMVHFRDMTKKVETRYRVGVARIKLADVRDDVNADLPRHRSFLQFYTFAPHPSHYYVLF